MATANRDLVNAPAGKQSGPVGPLQNFANSAPAAKKAQRQGPSEAAAPAKAGKPKKPKLVRDSFKMPKSEYALIDELKLRASHLGRPTKKSEVLRAGVMALTAMGDAAFLAAVGAVPATKTGRPAKS